MTLKHGLKTKTTEQYVQELASTGIIKSTREGKWILSRGKEIGDFIEQDREKDRSYLQ